MKIITLNEEQFNEYAKNHKYGSYYQSSAYAKVMREEGYEHHYLGFTNNMNELIGASVVLYKKIFFYYKLAYAPCGFLFDYNNNDLVEELTTRLKRLLLKQNFLFLKINPLVHCTERDKKGNIISFNPEINDVLEILKKNGYIHHGFNKYFETLKPRWKAVVKLTENNNQLYSNLNKQTRNKINKAKKLGIKAEKVANSKENLKVLYEFIKRKQNKPFKSYKTLMDTFKDSFEIYFAKIDSESYIKNSQTLYEKELIINEELNKKFQKEIKDGHQSKKLMNEKLESDKRLSFHRTNLENSTTNMMKNPNGLVIGGCIIIKEENKANLIIEGFDQDYRIFNPNYLLKWEIIKELNNDGFTSFDLNGIVGEFNEDNKYSGLNEMKLGFNAHAIEYIGEFDLIINKTVFNMYKKKQATKGKRV